MNFTPLFLFLNISRSSLFVVSQLKYFNLFDLYFNLKFLSKPNIIAFSKYLRNDAKDAPSQAPISNKLKSKIYFNSSILNKNDQAFLHDRIEKIDVYTGSMTEAGKNISNIAFFKFK